MVTDAPAVFFSYSRDDSEFALRLAKDVKAASVDVWMDQLNLYGGQRWAEAIQEALEKCPVVIVILSPLSISSKNVMDELAFALDENKVVIPVLVGDCKILLRLRSLQHVDFRGDYTRGLGHCSRYSESANRRRRKLRHRLQSRRRADAVLRMHLSENMRRNKRARRRSTSRLRSGQGLKSSAGKSLPRRHSSGGWNANGLPPHRLREKGSVDRHLQRKSGSRNSSVNHRRRQL